MNENPFALFNFILIKDLKFCLILHFTNKRVGKKLLKVKNECMHIMWNYVWIYAANHGLVIYKFICVSVRVLF